MKSILKPNKKYSLYELIEYKFIPGVDTYAVAYSLVTTRTSGERVLNDITTQRGLKAEHDGKPWGKISGKIYVRGDEINKFLQINNLL